MCQYLFMSDMVKIVPLGDEALVIRFADELDLEANKRAIEFAKVLQAKNLIEILEISPALVSVLIRYATDKTNFFTLSGLIRLVLSSPTKQIDSEFNKHKIDVIFDGEDLDEVASCLALTKAQFIKQHNAKALRVLATGFAPGFIFCGMHEKQLLVGRRKQVRRQVASGTILFAAGQTAITSTQIPTGWHIIGYTKFNNFDVSKNPPSIIKAGDEIEFANINTSAKK